MRPGIPDQARQTGLRLDELDREEMWDVVRALCPWLSREAFDDMWSGFVAEQARGRLH
jgi:hypothetical protein